VPEFGFVAQASSLWSGFLRLLSGKVGRSHQPETTNPAFDV